MMENHLAYESDNLLSAMKTINQLGRNDAFTLFSMIIIQLLEHLQMEISEDA